MVTTGSLPRRFSHTGDIVTVLLGIVIASVIATPIPAAEWGSGRASFRIRAGGEIIPYRVAALFVMPNDTLLMAVEDYARNRYECMASTGKLIRTTRRKWRWIAPGEPGYYSIWVANPLRGDTTLLNIFVLTPFERVINGYLNGYRIGAYPSWKEGEDPIYAPPSGFVEVTPATDDILVSPHFRLGQFIAKQGGGWPKYLTLRMRLVLMLERILERVNDNGCRAHSLYIMSGYRTPWYNEQLDNVPYSRHLWGDAADIFVDSHPVDGKMDDIDGSGNVDYDDAVYLYQIIEAIPREREYRLYIGGLSSYRANRVHGPFVHVDVRGKPARWED